ncbi:DUF3891 family protein [Solirubrum puertoriconensis]|uniref:DUF3891 domain-containing protein n=1 Tax=Solirubrum puertoriconensis TaxID=1751427 RepID=A0A9X0HL49_SOLP1|nr:DUF3891 family protein [Solirubrum puertoriconensis]KUG07963.1 hypothetical protein ASU33_07060 [Solirubrum puertoriconensis]
MIVNYTPEGWQIVYQQAHALLAAQLLYQWPAFLPLEQWVGLLAAVAQHDDGQRRWDGRYAITPAGAPADFTTKEFSLEQATEVMHQARFQGRWRSLLTSMHMSFLYEDLRGQRKDIDAFLDEQRQCQLRWRRELQVTKADAGRAYALLQWCDRFSLILCRHELPEMERALEISTGPDGQRYDVRQLPADDGITVEPWPFAADEFSVGVEVSVVHQLQFKDDQELSHALRQAPIQALRWQLRRR